MPDFDTRRPPEPDRPSRMHLFVVASRQHISAIGRWRDRTMARHRWVRIMVRYRWGLGLSLLVSLLVLVILGAVIIDRTVETPAEQLDQEKAQLDQELQLKAPPAYKVPGGEFDS